MSTLAMGYYGKCLNRHVRCIPSKNHHHMRGCSTLTDPSQAKNYPTSRCQPLDFEILHPIHSATLKKNYYLCKVITVNILNMVESV